MIHLYGIDRALTWVVFVCCNSECSLTLLYLVAVLFLWLYSSSLENPRDGGIPRAWWAAVYEVTQSQTRLKWLSSSSSRLDGKKKKRLKNFTVTPTDKIWVFSKWNRWKECSLAMPSRILLCSRDLNTGLWVLDRGVPVLGAQLQEVRGCGRIPWGSRISRSSAVAKLSKWSPLRPM